MEEEVKPQITTWTTYSGGNPDTIPGGGGGCRKKKKKKNIEV